MGLLERQSVRGSLALALVLAALAVIPYRLEVTAECVILPAQRRHVRAAMEGVLSEITVDEGAVVREGQVLARLDDRQLVAERRAAEARVERIRANLLRLRNGVRREEDRPAAGGESARESTAAFVQSELLRQQGLLSNGFVSQQTVEAAERDVQVALSEPRRGPGPARATAGRHATGGVSPPRRPNCGACRRSWPSSSSAWLKW